jgi:hypothetical protein
MMQIRDANTCGLSSPPAAELWQVTDGFLHRDLFHRLRETEAVIARTQIETTKEAPQLECGEDSRLHLDGEVNLEFGWSGRARETFGETAGTGEEIDWAKDPI